MTTLDTTRELLRPDDRVRRASDVSTEIGTVRYVRGSLLNVEWDDGSKSAIAREALIRDNTPAIPVPYLSDMGIEADEFYKEESIYGPRETIPSPEDFLAWIDGALDAVRERVRFGGQKYGEVVLFTGDELVSGAQVYTKASRILYSLKTGLGNEKSRDDSWLDLAGFAIIEIARRVYSRGLPPDGADGLYDRKDQT